MICGTWIHTGCDAEIECDDCCCCPNHCHCGHEWIERLKTVAQANSLPVDANGDITVTVDPEVVRKSFEINKGA